MTKGRAGAVGRSLTNEDIIKLEQCHSLKMLSDFEQRFLDDFAERFKLYGYKTNIFPKQEKVLEQLCKRLK